jgi:hypothetical protein
MRFHKKKKIRSTTNLMNFLILHLVSNLQFFLPEMMNGQELIKKLNSKKQKYLNTPKPTQSEENEI